jgi:hypothetical protein
MKNQGSLVISTLSGRIVCHVCLTSSPKKDDSLQAAFTAPTFVDSVASGVRCTPYVFREYFGLHPDV